MFIDHLFHVFDSIEEQLFLLLFFFIERSVIIVVCLGFWPAGKKYLAHMCLVN